MNLRRFEKAPNFDTEDFTESLNRLDLSITDKREYRNEKSKALPIIEV